MVDRTLSPCKVRGAGLAWQHYSTIGIFIMALACNCGTPAPVAPVPTAKGGILDLRNIDFRGAGDVELNGEWQFFWKKWLSPAQVTLENDGRTIYAPAAWNELQIDGKNLPGDGFASYRLVIEISELAPPLALRFDYQGSAYRAFWNGVEVAAAGQVGIDPGHELPEYMVQYAAVNNLKRNILVVHISNHQHRLGGLWLPLKLGSSKEIFSARDRSRLLESLLAGSLLIMFLYHLGLFLYRRQDKSPLWFAIVCLLMALRLSVTGERLLILSFPASPWAFFHKMEYASFYLTAPPMCLFLRSVFPAEMTRIATRIIVITFLAAGLAVLSLPAKWYSHTLIPVEVMILLAAAYATFALVRAVAHKKHSARLMLTGWLAFLLTITNDILFNTWLLGPGYIVPLGLFLFTLAQAAALFRRISKAFGEAEDLAVSLERKVIEHEEVERTLAITNRALDRVAHYDLLTGLPNRVLVNEKLQEAMATRQANATHLVAIFTLNLDGFKRINDVFGIEVGDALLIKLANLMEIVLGSDNVLARTGGDEFVGLIRNLEDRRAHEPFLASLLNAASTQVEIGPNLLQVSASIGVTLYPDDNAGAEQLLRHADQAMYDAKESGRNRYYLFDVAQEAKLKNQRDSLENFRSAFAQGEFLLYYQPKVNMKTGKVLGAEALIRWLHPEHGLVPPGAFLPIIENQPISVEVGEWVVDTALSQLEFWNRQGLTLSVSVNIAARQLQQNQFAARIKQLLQAHPQVNPAQLELEILETSALEDISLVTNIIDSCQALGVRFAIDDFGTGYSSLTYLKRLPAETLKIDQSFIRHMLNDPNDLAIVTGVIGLARAFKREVIAEGVETVEHGSKLLALGCDLAQGYHIAKPMPASELPGWVTTWRPDPVWTLGSLSADSKSHF